MEGNDESTKRLQQIAAVLSSNWELQKDLVQEMHLHLLKVQMADPGKPLNWYLKSCEFYARNWMRQGRSVDSLKRARQRMPIEVGGASGGTPADNADLHGEMMNVEIVAMINPHLTERQRVSLEMLISGHGVRETARRMGISHPAVIKHRRKIARLAAAYMQRQRVRQVTTGVTR